MDDSSTWPRATSTPTDPAAEHDRTAGPGEPPRSPSPPCRRWPWIVAVVVLLAATGSAGAIAWDQRETAAEWQQRAEALEDQRDDALGRGEALQLQLEEIAELLSLSEEDVERLEERIRELAGEVAQAQDTATTVQVERDVLADLSTRVAEAVEALDACITRLFDLQAASVEAFNRAAQGEPVDVEPLNAQARATTDFCNDARAAAAAAASAADRIPG